MNSAIPNNSRSQITLRVYFHEKECGQITLVAGGRHSIEVSGYPRRIVEECLTHFRLHGVPYHGDTSGVVEEKLVTPTALAASLWEKLEKFNIKLKTM